MYCGLSSAKNKWRLYSLVLICSFSCFLFAEVLVVPSFILPNLVIIFNTTDFNPLSGKCLILILLLFLKLYPVLSIERYSFVLSFCFSVPVSMY